MYPGGCRLPSGFATKMVVMGSTAGAFPVFSADVLPFAKEPAICGQFKQRMQ
ncbi:hypothetical protein BDV29DRAFT_185419, partial [Aspergillus leporis]